MKGGRGGYDEGGHLGGGNGAVLWTAMMAASGSLVQQALELDQSMTCDQSAAGVGQRTCGLSVVALRVKSADGRMSNARGR